MRGNGGTKLSTVRGCTASSMAAPTGESGEITKSKATGSTPTAMAISTKENFQED